MPILYLQILKLAIKTVLAYPGIPEPEATRDSVPPAAVETTPEPLALATTKDTIVELKRRLGKELYRMQMDLEGGGRIANRACDCLSAKHHLGLEATAEELISMDSNPVYNEVISWLNRHAATFEPREIAKHPKEYYQGLSPSLREFRKRVMGTGELEPLLNEDEQEVLANARAMARAKKEA